MTFVNLTEHPIIVYFGGTVIKTIPPSGAVARVRIKEDEVGVEDGVQIVKLRYSKIVNLPEPVAGTFYIVSTKVAMAAKRKDVVSPNTGFGAIRNENGDVVAVKSLQMFGE